MRADLVERIKMRVPRAALDPGLLRDLLAAADEALEYAAQSHDSVDPFCDHEPEAGAGAMRAIIQYRELIRAMRA